MLTRIDDLTRDLYTFLSADDECYFLREYTSRCGYEYSRTNDLISNLKKPVDRRGKKEWRYKEWAIRTIAEEFRESFGDLAALREQTIVPVPPSSHRTDPLYDDRMLQILNRIDPASQLDIRELVTANATVPPDHAGACRQTVADLVGNYSIDETLTAPRPRSLAVFDDVLTTGRHFVAMKRVLLERFPGIPVRGFFAARRVFAESESSDE